MSRRTFPLRDTKNDRFWDENNRRLSNCLKRRFFNDLDFPKPIPETEIPKTFSVTIMGYDSSELGAL